MFKSCRYFTNLFLKERNSLKNDIFRFDVFFNIFRFLEKWTWISINFLFRDTCLNGAHVLNRLKFDTFLLSYFFWKMVSVMNEPHCHKKIITCLTKNLKWLWYDIITKSICINNTWEDFFSAKLLVFSEVFLNISQISVENTCAWYNVNAKVSL